MLLGKYINKYYLRYAPLYILGVIALIAIDYIQLLLPEYLGQLVDLFDGSGSVDMGALNKIILGVAIVGVSMFAGRMLWRFCIFSASHKAEADLRQVMFVKSLKLSQKYYHENKVGTVMAWFTTDIETIEEFMGWGTIMLTDAFFLSILVIIKMIVLDWVLSILVFVPLILIVVWGALVEKFMSMKWEERQTQYDRLYDFSQESFTGIRVIKAFLKENKQLKEFAKIAQKNKQTNISFVKCSVLFNAIIDIIIALIMAIMMGVGGYVVYLTVTGNPFVIFGHTVEMTAGNLITFVGYFESMIWPMIALGQIISMRSRAKASLKRVTGFLDSEEDIKNPDNAKVLENVQGSITLKNFSFTYPGGAEPALKNVDLHIEPGETVGIVGRIGCGKSTLASVLLRLYNVEKGTLFIDGEDIMDCDVDSVRGAIAYVPQDNFLFSDRISGNIAFSKGEADEETVKKAAEFACVADDIAGFEKGYDTVTGERGVTLSGGQKQRVSIARAYLTDAPIMILDDSVSAVDVKTEETILKNIERDRAGKTTLIIASRVSTVAHADKILVLNEGSAEAFDTPERLAESSPTYQKMVYLQTLEKEVEGGDR